MSTRLAIGVVDTRPGWEILLGQLGVWTERLDWNRVDASSYCAIIVNRSLSRYEGDRLDEYLRGGGALFDNGGYAAHASIATRPHSFSTIVGTEPPFEDVGLVDVHDRVRSLAGARELGGTVALVEHGGGWLAHVPFDIERIMRSARAARRRFHSPGGHHPDEVVASIAKSPYRAIVEAALVWLHARRNLPYVHRWHFPGDARSIFAFRIDSDYGTAAHMLRLRAIAERHGVPLTLFLHVAAHVDHLDIFRDFEPHELAVHGYRHRTFSQYETNWGNIAEALQVMRSAGLDPKGFAAPTGQWNRGVDRALRELGFAYSTEFTLDYDGLPLHPWNGRTVSSVLQIPVHPISVGNLDRSGADAPEILAYFNGVIDRQLARRLPVVLYHHPLQESWDVFDALLERAQAEQIPLMTMGAYATWWSSRGHTRYSARIDGEVLSLELPATASDVRVRVVSPEGRECYLASGADVALASLPWRARATNVVTLPSDIASIRRPTLSMLRHSLEDAVSRFRQ